MRGKKTDKKLIAEIAELLKLHSPADVVSMMGSRLSRRTTYRLIEKLREDDEKRKMVEAEQFRQSMQRRSKSRLEYLRSRRRYKKTSDFPLNLRRVKSF